MPDDDKKQPETKQPEAKKDAAPPAPEKEKEYAACFGGPITDPESKITFTGQPKFAPLTRWLKAQIAAGKIKEQATGERA